MMARARVRSLCAVGAAMFLHAAPTVACAQPADRTATLRVSVIDTEQQPVVSAEVVLLHGGTLRHVARTDSAGRTTLTGIEPGMWSVAVRRLGFTQIATTVRLAAGRNEFTLHATPVALSLTGIRVVGGVEYSARLEGFEQRRLSGSANAVVTRSEIDRLDPPKLSRMLRGLGGLQIADSAGSTVAVSRRGAKPTRNTLGVGYSMVQCVLRVVLDGVLLPPLFNVDDIVPRDVHGIEVYYGPSRLPPELSGVRTDSWCGAIVIWTRDR